jgi:hypothetical protein
MNMKQTKKLFGAALMIIAAMTVLAGCGSTPQAGGGGSGGQAGDANKELDNFKAVLSAAAENTEDIPATVALKLSNLQDRWGDINAAVLNAGRYVVLDLSDCTVRENNPAEKNRMRGEVQQIKDNQYIKGIILPSTLTAIESNAFSGNTQLVSVTFPDSLVSIGDSAFSGNTQLVSVSFPDSPDSLASIGDETFKNTPWEKDFLAAQPDGVVYIGKVAYRYKGAMPRNTSLALKEGTVGIAGSAFYRCEGLTSITIPDSVVYINAWAFGRDAGVTRVALGKSVAFIGSDAFRDCKMTALTIPASVTFIHCDAFRECSNLTSLAVDEGNPAYSVQDGVLYNKDKTTLVRYPPNRTGTSFVIPKTVTAIEKPGFTSMFENLTVVTVEAGSPAFTAQDGVLYSKDMTELVCYPPGKGGSSFVIPDTVKTIGRGAFASCKSLTSVTIPNSVTSIENKAFIDAGLRSVTIPASVKSIGGNAFTDVRLTSVTFAAGSNIAEKDFGDYVFQGEERNALKTMYLSQGAGTYVRDPANARVWTKQ